MKRKYIIAIVIASLVLILDQFTKWLVMTRMVQGSSKEIIPDFFYLTYLVNDGAAFGLFRDMDERYRAVFFLVVGNVGGKIGGFAIRFNHHTIFFITEIAGFKPQGPLFFVNNLLFAKIIKNLSHAAGII